MTNQECILAQIHNMKQDAASFHNLDYRTGYWCALSTLEGFIAMLPPENIPPTVLHILQAGLRWHYCKDCGTYEFGNYAFQPICPVCRKQMEIGNDPEKQGG